MDYAEGRRFWPRAAYGEQVSFEWRIHPLFHSRTDRDGWILVHGGAEYPGLYALRKIAESANGGAGAWTSDGDDTLCVHRRGGNFGVSGAVRSTDLGSSRAAWQVQSAVGRVCRLDSVDDRHAEYQCRGECGFAVERFFQPATQPDFVSHRRV